MSAEIATLERVRHAVETLRRSGATPTADRVIALIGGGKSTVLAHLKTIRNSAAEPPEIPAAVLDMAKAMAAEVYRAGRAAESDALKTATERLSSYLEEQDAQIEELNQQNEELSARTTHLSKQFEQLVEQRKELQDMLRRREVENEDLRTQLLEERRKAEENVKGTLARMERMIERAAHDFKPMRKTLSLPGAKGE